MRPEVVQQKVAAIEEHRRNNHVGVYSPERQVELPRQCPAPALRLAAWILITNNHRGLHFAYESGQRILRMPPDYETDSALFCVLGDIPQTLRKKVIVPE